MIIDCHNHVGVELLHYLRGDFPYAQQLESLVREGDALGVQRWIVFPMVTNLALSLEAMRDGRVRTEGGLENTPYAWENRRLMREVYDLFPAAGRHTIPFAMFDPARRPEAQVQALRELRGQYRFCGLKTQTTMLQSPITSLVEAGHVFLELALEWDLPILIHSSVLPSDVWAQASDILDIAERTPEVRFCVAHSCRFDRTQLDRTAALPNVWFDCSAHGIHCELATTDHPVVAPPQRRFDSDYTQPATVLHDLATAYPGKMLWGSDSPYYSFVSSASGSMLSLLSSYAQEVGYLTALPVTVQQEISERNTLQFLNLPQ